MKYDRDFRLTVICGLCDGRQRLTCAGFEIECSECAGTGEVVVAPVEEMEDVDA